MENTLEFFDACYELLDEACKLARRNCEYNFLNAWRTCTLLADRIETAICVVDLYLYERDQYYLYLSAVDNNITFDNLKEENEFEKMTFKAEKNHRKCMKCSLKKLEGLKDIITYTCDNQRIVKETCGNFVQLIDDVIDHLDLKE